MALVLLGFVVSIYSINRQIRPPYGSQLLFQLEIDANTQQATFHLLPDSTRKVSGAKALIQLDSQTLAYNLNPKLMVWALIFSVLFGLALGSVPLSVGRALTLISRFSLGWKTLGGSLLGILVFFVLVTLVSSGDGSGKLMSAIQLIVEFKVLFWNPLAIEIMISVVVLTGSLAVFGILVINFCAPKVTKSGTHEPLEKFSALKFLDDSLNIFLGIISVLIMLSVVALSVLHQAIQSQLKVINANIFPSDFIYAYGLVFTIFLGIVYLPTHFHLNLLLQEEKESGEISRLSMEEQSKLVLGGSLRQSFQVLFAIVAPLLGSALSEMLQQVAF